MKVILDASALLAWLQGEPGAALVVAELAESAISSLNWSEVLQKSIAHGVDVGGLRLDLEALGLEILPFTTTDAEEVAQLWQAARHLSLADRACLVLGLRHNLPVWTTDRMWATISIGAVVRVLR